MSNVLELLKSEREILELNRRVCREGWPAESLDMRLAAYDVAIAQLESAKPVNFTSHGHNAPAYSCNKPGDMSGTYYRYPQEPTNGK
jgi:hypothetical protein